MAAFMGYSLFVSDAPDRARSSHGLKKGTCEKGVGVSTKSENPEDHEDDTTSPTM